MKTTFLLASLLLTSLPAFADCTPGLVDGTYVPTLVSATGPVNRLGANLNFLFPSEERTDRQNFVNQQASYIVENFPVTLAQQGCSQIVVRQDVPANVEHLSVIDQYHGTNTVSLAPIDKESVTFGPAQIQFKRHVGGHLFNYREYTITIKKLPNGNLSLDESVTGEALLPTPAPVTWTRSILFKKVLTK